MSLPRRGALFGFAAALAAPAIVRAESIWLPPPRRIVRIGQFASIYNNKAIRDEIIRMLIEDNAFIRDLNYLPGGSRPLRIRLPTDYRTG
jgi:hypothetical protein